MRPQAAEFVRITRPRGLAGVELRHAHYVKRAFPRHSHDELALAFMEEGVMEIYLRGTYVVLTPGDIVVSHPGDVHSGKPINSDGFRYKMMYIAPCWLDRLARRQHGAAYFPNTVFRDSLLHKRLIDLHSASEQQDSAVDRECQIVAVLDLLMQRHARQGKSARADQADHPALRRAVAFLAECMDDDVSLSDLSHVVRLHPVYLSRLFTRELGMPPHAFHLDMRLRRAKGLIERGQALAEVAASLGFSDQAHLTRHFQRQFGATPGQYRLHPRPSGLRPEQIAR